MKPAATKARLKQSRKSAGQRRGLFERGHDESRQFDPIRIPRVLDAQDHDQVGTEGSYLLFSFSFSFSSLGRLALAGFSVRADMTPGTPNSQTSPSQSYSARTVQKCFRPNPLTWSARKVP